MAKKIYRERELNPAERELAQLLRHIPQEFRFRAAQLIAGCEGNPRYRFYDAVSPDDDWLQFAEVEYDG